MLYGTSHDTLNKFGFKPSQGLRGLAYSVYTGTPWILDPVYGASFISGLYGTAPFTTVLRNAFLKGSSGFSMAYQTSDGSNSYLMLKDDSGNTISVVIALNPVYQRNTASYTYKPAVVSADFTPVSGNAQSIAVTGSAAAGGAPILPSAPPVAAASAPSDYPVPIALPAPKKGFYIFPYGWSFYTSASGNTGVAVGPDGSQYAIHSEEDGTGNWRLMQGSYAGLDIGVEPLNQGTKNGYLFNGSFSKVSGFPPLDAGSSYVLLAGETTADYPGGQGAGNEVFLNPLSGFAQITPQGPDGTPAILLGGDSGGNVPIPPSKQFDRWEIHVEQTASAVEGTKTYKYYAVVAKDLNTGDILTQAIEHVDDSAGGSSWLPIVSRVITDVSTMGMAEAARAAAQAAGISQENINLATEAGAALAVAVATAGTLSVISSAASGAAATAAGTDVATAGIGGVTEGAAGATDAVASVTAGVGGAVNAAGDTGAALGITGAAGAGTTTALVGAAGSSTGASVGSAIATDLAKIAVGSATAVGSSALTAEIKKLTGQTPQPVAAPPSSGNLTINAAPQPLAKASGIAGFFSSTLGKAVAAVAAVAVLTKKS